MPCEQHPAGPLTLKDRHSGALTAFALLAKPYGTYHLSLATFQALLRLWREGNITSGWLVRRLPGQWGLEECVVAPGVAQCTDLVWAGDETAAEAARLGIQAECEPWNQGWAVVMAPQPPSRSQNRHHTEPLNALWMQVLALAEGADRRRVSKGIGRTTRTIRMRWGVCRGAKWMRAVS